MPHLEGWLCSSSVHESYPFIVKEYVGWDDETSALIFALCCQMRFPLDAGTADNSCTVVWDITDPLPTV